MTRKTLEHVAHILIAMSLCMPLLVFPGSFIFPFVVPKILFFRATVVGLFGVYLLLLYLDFEHYRPKQNIVHWAVFFFFLSFFISTFTGVDWYRSMWDNHERMLGLFTVAHFVAYYFILSSLLRDWKDWRRFLRLFLFVGIIIMAIGGWQVYGDSSFLLNRGKDRVSSTLGNAIYFSGLGFFLFCLGTLLLAKEKEKAWQWFTGAGTFLGFMGIFWGGTRGTLLGFFGAVCTALFVALCLYWKERSIRYRLLGTGFLCVVLVAGVFLFRHSSVVQSINPVRRLVNIDIASLGNDTRVMAWSIAVESWKEYPWFGWGPNNYYYAFNEYYLPEFLLHGYGETWFDNAHSAIFNTLSVQGGIGLAAYVGMFVIAGIFLVTRVRRGQIEPPVFLIGASFLVGHFIHNATVFENPTSYLYFFFFLAFLASYASAPANTSSSKSFQQGERTKIAPGMVGGALIAVLLFVYTTDINPARANTASLKAIAAMGSDPLLALTFFEKNSQIPTPHVDDIRADFARNAAQAAVPYAQKGFQSEAITLAETAVGEVRKNLLLHPLDIRSHFMFTELAHSYKAITNSSVLLQEAEELLEQALVASPKRQQLLFMLGNLKQEAGKFEEAQPLFELALREEPRVAEGWWRLALLHTRMNDHAAAEALLLEAGEKGIIFSEAETALIEKYIAATSSL